MIKKRKGSSLPGADNVPAQFSSVTRKRITVLIRSYISSLYFSPSFLRH